MYFILILYEIIIFLLKIIKITEEPKPFGNYFRNYTYDKENEKKR